jgi:hypothetical protein
MSWGPQGRLAPGSANYLGGPDYSTGGKQREGAIVNLAPFTYGEQFKTDRGIASINKVEI